MLTALTTLNKQVSISMANVAVAGILRAGKFSPNHVGSDAAILNAVAALLRRRGITVNLYSEDQFIAHGIESEQIVMAMTRDERSISRLHNLEDQGRIVINSGYGISHCARGNMVRIFAREGIPQPETLVVSTDENVKSKLDQMGFERCWVKRADCQTVHKEDVACARHAQEAQDLLGEFFIRGIRTAVIARDVHGSHVKFYGVVGTDFFHCYLSRGGNSDALDAEELRVVCTKAAKALGVEVYGGDAMVDPTTGSFVIVSFNDWPGFAPCREDAAKGICKLVSAHARKLMKR